MARSFGDVVASNAGVICDPGKDIQILKRNICQKYRRK